MKYTPREEWLKWVNKEIRVILHSEAFYEGKLIHFDETRKRLCITGTTIFSKEGYARASPKFANKRSWKLSKIKEVLVIE